MRKILIVALLAALCGFAVARWMPSAPPDAPSVSPQPVEVSFDANRPVDARLADLERAVSVERQARQFLEDELAYVNEQLDDLRAGQPVDGAEPSARGDRALPGSVGGRRGRPRNEDPTTLTEQLVDGGFAPDRAAWIVRRTSELEVAALNARYEAMRSGDWSAARDFELQRTQTLHNELGDADYDRYLTAMGRSTSVDVNNVLESSPAARAGLRAGDRIVRYGGERVYDMGDLMRATMSGQSGETVIVEVRRDGDTVQIPLTRGPLGIASGGRFRPR